MPAKKKTAPKKKKAAPKKKKTAPKKKKAAPKKKPAATITRICSMCGTTAQCPAQGIPAGWTITVGGRHGVEFMCDDCARRNIRAIEGKLPEEWWE